MIRTGLGYPREYLQKPRAFFGDESGAVTVDWVVLTAAVVGLGVAVATSVSGGTTALAGKVATAMGGAEVSVGSAGSGAAQASGWAAYLAAAGGDIAAAAQAVEADAPDGYNFVSAIDNATGQPIYASTETAENLSIGGQTTTYAEYMNGGADWTYYNEYN